MKSLVAVVLLFFISVVGLCAPNIEGKMEYTLEDRELSPLEKETFDILKQQFPSELLDAQLETLHLVADSDEYVNFLSKKYPKLAPFTTFQDVFYKVLPPKELYFNRFFNKHLHIATIEEVTDDDLFIAYAYTAGHWKYSVRKKGLEMEHESLPRDGERVLTTPKGRKVLEQRVGINANTERFSWVPALRAFRPLIDFSEELIEEDHNWIKSLFEKHGETDAMLHIAVQTPMLLDRILYAFSTDKTFKRWIYNPVDTNTDRRK